ncbi:MAG: tetratricopeptide repeat protein, partial [Candidatus Aminicenantes bacterium]|nr:tetratricopeptide repeat protein [Candidatus Aminicenantes bacterium]
MSRYQLKRLVLILIFLSPMVVFAQTSKVFEVGKESLLALAVYGSNKELIAKGCGFSVGQELIATAYQLVSSADTVEGTTVKGKKIKVEGIIAVDRIQGVAILKIKGNLPLLKLGDSSNLSGGMKIIGLGANEAGEIVSAEGNIRQIAKLSSDLTILTSSLSIPASFCGGPVLNENGEIIALIHVLERGAVGLVPVNNWKSQIKLGKFTEFKNWKKEDYLATLEGALLAGKIHTINDNIGDGQKYLEKAIKLNPNLIEIQTQLAEIYSRQRDFSSAINAYRKVLELDPNRGEAYFGLGSVYVRMMKWAEAVAPLERAIQMGVQEQEAWRLLATAFEEMKNFDRAAGAYEKYVSFNPPEVWGAYLRLGLCRMELQQFEAAVKALEEAQKRQPNDIKVNYTLAQAYQKAKQYEKAEKTYRLLAELSPPDAASYYGMIVRMYDEIGQYDRAIEAAKKVVEINPTNELAVYNLGIMYFKLERYDEAIVAFRKALEIRPTYELSLIHI